MAMFYQITNYRMETVKLRRISGMAKVIGVALCFTGIMTIAFYTGPHLNPLNHHHLFSHKSSSQDPTPTNSKATWIKGIFFMITSNATWSLWLVLQVISSKINF